MFSLACTNCEWSSPDQDIDRCPQCGATIDLRYAKQTITDDPSKPGIWRHVDHLPLHDLTYAVTLGEGNTPLLHSAQLGAQLGLPELYFKLEGNNPTGSYKDRIAAVGIARLQELGKRAWAATSSANPT